MDKIILSPIELNDLLTGLRTILKEELQQQNKEQFSERLLSPSETCKLFDPVISKPTLSTWTDQGLLKSYKFGNKIFYKVSEVLEAGKTVKKYKRPVIEQNLS